MIFRRQLDEMAAAHPDKLKVVHALSREPDAGIRGPNVCPGRVCEALLREHILDPTAVEVFTGPGIGKFERLAAKEKGEEPKPRFLETALDALEAIGVPDEKVHRESYG